MSKYTKAIAGFVGFATAVTMTVGSAFAATNEELQAQITALLAQITSLQSQLGTAQTPVGTTVGAYTFSVDLKLGSTGTDVMNLQKVLNSSADTQVAVTGAGSPGSESTYFGGLTKAAVMKFQTKHAIAPVAGYVGAKTRAVLNTMGGTTGGVVTPTGTAATVALSFDNPASGTIIAGQAVADLAHFTFSNPTGTEVKVTKIVLGRTGVSNDATLANVYLFEGAARITDAATPSLTKITFNDASGLFTIPAGGMKTIAVKSDITSGTSGQIVGVSLLEVTGTATVSGAFPVLGNNQSVASADISYAYFSTVGSSMSPASETTVDPQTDYIMWSNTLNVGLRTADLHSISFRMIGSVLPADLANFRLSVDGVIVGSPITSVDANNYVTFVLPTPVKLTTGGHQVKLIGDVVGGSTKTFVFTIQEAGDVKLVDSQLNVPVLLAADHASTPTAFSSLTANNHYLVNSGDLSIVKTTDTPSGNVTLSGSNVLLAKYTLKATGESIKVEKLRVEAISSMTETDEALRNGTLTVGGVQIGNTLSIKGDSNTVTTGTEFNLGGSLVVVPGTPVVLEVRADVYNDGADTIVSGDSVQIEVTAPANSLKKLSSGTYLAAKSAVPALSLSVAVGGLSASMNTAYGAPTIVVPKTAYKIGSFNLVSTETENINLNTITIALAGVDYATNTTDLYVKYGTKTTNVKSTVTASNEFNISETLLPNTTMPIEVYATLSSTLAGTVTSSLSTYGLTANSNTTVCTGYSGSCATLSGTTGQVVTVSTSAAVSAALVTDSTLATKLLVGNTQPKVASFRFSAVDDTFTVTDIALKASTTDSGAVNSITLKSSGMTDKIIFFGAPIGDLSVATSTGMSLTVPANGSTVVDVYLNLNTIGTGNGATGSNVGIILQAFKAQNSGGVSTAYPNDVVANWMYVYKSIPTIALVSLPSTGLTAGTKTISKFSVTADAAGAIGWKKIIWNVAKTDGVTFSTTTGMSLVDSNNNTIAGTFTPSVNFETTSVLSGTLSFVATDEQQLTSSETYQLKVNILSPDGSNDSISTYINSASSYAAPQAYGAIGSFVWTDRSLNSHDESSLDWNSDYKVKNLPTDTQTLTTA